MLGAVGTGVVVGLAGCGGDDGADDPTLEAEPNYGGWFDGVGNDDGTNDRRNEDVVAVDVGVQADDYTAFGPAAVAVSPGTTVRWAWTGQGGAHDVVGQDGGFDSGDPVRSDGLTYERDFAEPGSYRYYCSNHREDGIRGAIFAGLGDWRRGHRLAG